MTASASLPAIPPGVLPRRLGVAVAVSVCAHAGLLWWACLRPAVEHAALISQRKGALTVVSLELAGPHRTTAPAPRPMPPLAPAAQVQRPAAAKDSRDLRLAGLGPEHRSVDLAVPVAVAPSVPQAANQPVSQPVPQSVAEAASETPAPPSTTAGQTPPPNTPAGSRFANIFAPIVRTPLGQGRWAARPQPQQQAINAEQQRMQAVLALRSLLQERLEGWAAALRASGRQAVCDLAVDATRRVGQAQCAHDDEAAQLWVYLRGVLMDGPVVGGALPATNDAPRKAPDPGAMGVLCLHVSQAQVVWQGCAPPAAADVVTP